MPRGAASTERRVWSQRSSPAILFCGTPRCAASSGAMTASRPVSSASRSPTEGRGASRRRMSSAPIRSPERCADQRGVGGDRGQRRGLDLELERGREPHRADHPQRVLAEPGAGVADRPQDAAPEVGDAVERVDDRGFGPRSGRRAGAGVAGSRPHAIALTVKSRRARSSRCRRRTRRRCGRRKSAYSCSLRNVVISRTSPSRRTATVPNAFSYTAPGNSCEHPVGSRVGREVPVLGRSAEQRVTHRAADDVRRRGRARAGRSITARTVGGQTSARRAAALP